MTEQEAVAAVEKHLTYLDSTGMKDVANAFRWLLFYKGVGLMPVRDVPVQVLPVPRRYSPGPEAMEDGQ